MTGQPIETVTWNKFEGLSDPRLQPAYPCVPHESEHGWVLVWSNFSSFVDIACLVWDDHEAGLWHWANQNGEEIHNVTHWMPLPEPPED